MRPDELAAHSRKQAAENDTAVLTALAAAGDTGIRPGGELAGAVGLPETTVRGVVARLVAHGLARRDGKRRVWATDAGRSEAGAGTPGLSLAPTLDAAITCLPAEALRAFVRLQVAAIPVRWHFAREIADGWPSFISVGPTSTGKTAIARLVCRIYGLEELVAIKAAFRQTPGSLVGRRERDARSATGWRVEPSPVLALPYLALDEWDKAARDVQAAAGGLLMGDTADELERERFEIRPTVYTTLNAGREGLSALHDAHVRRAVVLNTEPLRPLLRDLDEDIARLFGGGVLIPRLRLEQIRPSRASLPPELRGMLRSELRAGLTEEGWRLADVETLSRLALGRSAITGGPLELAALATAADYLTCSSTLGHAQDGFAARLASRLGAHGAMLPDLTTAEEERHAHERDRQQRQHDRSVTQGAFIEERGTLAQQLKELTDRLDLRRSPMHGASVSDRSAVKGLADRLAALRDQAHQARNASTLQDVEQRAREPLGRALQLLANVEREHAAKAELGQALKEAKALGNVPAAYKNDAGNLRAEADALIRALPDAHGGELVELTRRTRAVAAAAGALPARIEREQAEQFTRRQQANRRRERPRAGLSRPPTRPQLSPGPPAAPPAAPVSLPDVLTMALAPLSPLHGAPAARRRAPAGGLGRCPGCNRVYPTSVNHGARLTKCTACDRPLVAVR